MQFSRFTTIDTRLERLTRHALRRDEGLFGCDIQIQVKDRCLYAAGVVTDFMLKMTCEEALSAVPGIRTVFNEIVVQVPPGDRLADEAIRRAALTRIGDDERVHGQRIAIHVHDGWLWLDGIVAHQAQRGAAQEIGARVRGIRGMTNLLRLEPRKLADDTHELIEQTLARRMGDDAADIRVDIVGHTALLHGVVASLRIRRLSEECVWAPGISAVDNQIEIGG